MARNPLTNFLKAAFSEALVNDPEWEPIHNEWKKSRRNFIKNLSMAAGSMVLLPSYMPVNRKSPIIAIIGAGMAGLSAAYELNKKGIKAMIFESSARAGGRMFTMRNHFGEGITTDIGGEFVDTTHTDIIKLAKELNLDFYDLRLDKLSPKTFYFGGKHMDQSDLRKAISPYANQIMKDIVSLPPLIDHTTAESFRQFDEQSITQYLLSLGINGWLFDFISVVLTREYGMEAGEQSAINFLIMFVPPLNADIDYQLFGPTHEVFKIIGGSQQLTDSIFETLKTQVIFNHRLTSVRQQANGEYEIVFSSPGGEHKEKADYILMTIPFSILRNISFAVPMAEEKRKCIDELGYGNSCKFVMGVNQKPWRNAKQQGYTFTDLSFGAGWDSSQMQSFEKGSFTVFGGGNFGNYMNETKEELLKGNFHSELNTIYPSAENIFADKNIKYCWAANPNAKGGYSAFKKGQWSTLSGWEETPVGNIFFAGEHVSKEFQGYMNGAAETSRVAVNKMLQQISKESN
jgi:monoamine oxidase